MDWLLEHAERYRSQIQSGPFFKRLASSDRKAIDATAGRYARFLGVKAGILAS